ncbi:MAG TPA: tRNA lysidine(34) synthetase TilS [Propionicimonas sp.]|nr:tRNA lysidine(34) synthetase TilS [Propionicimonas sp.]HRA06437.1 tRNA lysidine(34) synthetase TilS [Propionicimonas sp.]
MAASSLMARRALGPATQQVVAAVDLVVAGPVLVACSGGPDSLALAAAAAIVGRRRDLPVRAVTVDHGLQDGSADVAARVAAQLEVLGVPTMIVPVVVDAAGLGPEAAAREARYAALDATAVGAEVVLLGHTLDDQAETVLLGLARGSGTRSLAGMPPRRGRFVRPLLGVRAETTRQACAELGLEPWTDPHNTDERFARVRARGAVMAALEAELGPGIAEALARTADLARADADLLDELAARELTSNPGPDLDCRWLESLPPALLTRVLLGWLRAAGAADLTSAHLVSVASLVHAWRGQRWVEVPGLRVLRAGGRLVVRDPLGGADGAAVR